MILEALGEAGGVAYLVRQAKKRNPAPFMALVGKTLPMTVKGPGPNGQHEARLVVEFVAKNPNP